MDGATWLGIGTLATAVVGLSLVVWQLREQRKAMRADFGNLYIQRYWQIDDDLLLVSKGTDLHRQHRHRYLRLYEDEFDVANLGFFDKDQWSAWHGLLDDEKAVQLLESDLAVCDPNRESFENLRRCLGQRRSDGRPHSVRECAARK